MKPDPHLQFRNTLTSLTQYRRRIPTRLNFHDLAVSIKRIETLGVNRKAESAKYHNGAQSWLTGILLSFGHKSRRLPLVLESLGAHG